MPSAPTSAPALHQLVLDRLKEVAAGRLVVFDGLVKDPPLCKSGENTGAVLPYLVLWGSAGNRPGAAQSLAGIDGSERDWPFQVTAAAGTQCWCLEAADIADEALVSFDLPNGGRIYEDGDTGRVRFDKGATPPRFFVPLLYRGITG